MGRKGRDSRRYEYLVVLALVPYKNHRDGMPQTFHPFWKDIHKVRVFR